VAEYIFQRMFFLRNIDFLFLIFFQIHQILSKILVNILSSNLTQRRQALNPLSSTSMTPDFSVTSSISV